MDRSYFDLIIFLARHVVLTFAVIFVCGWIAARLGVSWDSLRTKAPTLTRRVVVAVAGGLLAV